MRTVSINFYISRSIARALAKRYLSGLGQTGVALNASFAALCQLACFFFAAPSSLIMSQPSVSRKKSLRIPTEPPPLKALPIPPSLLQSPHLNSPQSIFRRAMGPSARVPRVDDEWLQDTVPQHGAVKPPPPQETKDPNTNATEQARRPSQGAQSHRPMSTPGARPPLPKWPKSEPNIHVVRTSPVENDGYFVGF
ncbi:hypothetical protein DFH06DRAFT_23943 [Mycena polygramma]|nr:hypothetical protein DFH06DRAFT_23943 [Mycena polygramma]